MMAGTSPDLRIPSLNILFSGPGDDIRTRDSMLGRVSDGNALAMDVPGCRVLFGAATEPFLPSDGTSILEDDVCGRTS